MPRPTLLQLKLVVTWAVLCNLVGLDLFSRRVIGLLVLCVSSCVWLLRTIVGVAITLAQSRVRCDSRWRNCW